MTGFRSLIRQLLGVERTPTYYLPWLSRPGLDCALILSNVEARFMEEHREGSFPLELVQHAASGAVVTRYAVTLPDSVTSVELPLQPGEGGCGFVTVDAALVHSDLYVTLSAGDAYAVTHGRSEFVERYPLWTRLLVDALGHQGAVVIVIGIHGYLASTLSSILPPTLGPSARIRSRYRAGSRRPSCSLTSMR